MNSSRNVPCIKCDGSGKIQAFMHIDSGRCFACAGAGTVEVDDSKIRPVVAAPWDRARYILEFSRIISAAESHYRERGEWLDVADTDDQAYIRTIRYNLAHAPVDVATRARVALSRTVKDRAVLAAILAE